MYSIALIHNDESVHNDFDELCNQNGWDLIALRDGKEALSMLKQGMDADVVILDILLPKHDGFELMQQIRKHPTHATIPVVVYTSLHHDDDHKTCYELGANGLFSTITHQPIEVLKHAISLVNE